MKTPWLIGIVVGVHLLGAGVLVLIQGCGTVPPPAKTAATPAVSESIPMPPKVVMETPKPEQRAPLPPIKQWPAETTTYIVRQGDALSTVARRFNLSTTEISTLNNLKSAAKLRVGQKLILPGRIDIGAPPPKAEPAAKAAKPAPKVEKPARPEPVSEPAAAVPVAAAGGSRYVVQSGDSLSKIAKKLGVTTSALRKANNLTGDKIRIGQKLAVPAASPAEKPVETPVPAAGAPAPTAPATAGPAAPAVPAIEPVKPAPPPPPAPAVTPALAPAAAVKAPAVRPPKATPVAAPAVKPDASAAAGKSAAPSSFRTHVVVADEDIYSVAMMWNVSVEKLKEVNSLTDAAIKPGQRLKIPISE